MKEFQLDSEKAHFFVLVDFAKGKVLQLIHIEKNTNTVNAIVLHQQESDNLDARLKLSIPTHEKILRALQFNPGEDHQDHNDAESQYKMPEMTKLKNTNKELDNDMFMVFIVDKFLARTSSSSSSSSSSSQSSMISTLTSFQHSAMQEFLQMLFNVTKENILR